MGSERLNSGLTRVSAFGRSMEFYDPHADAELNREVAKEARAIDRENRQLRAALEMATPKFLSAYADSFAA